MKAIVLEHVTKAYRNKIVLDRISLEFEYGEIIAVIGASGSGKSTLLNIIGLLEARDSGSIFINGFEVNTLSSSKVRDLLRNDIGYLFQNYGLIDNETVAYNLKLVMKYHNISKKEKEQLIGECLNEVGLNGFENNIIATLSGGEQQRIAIARLLLKNPSIILCDEPTGSLDQSNATKIMDLITSLRNDKRVIVIVTHDPDVAARCDHILEL